MEHRARNGRVVELRAFACFPQEESAAARQDGTDMELEEAVTYSLTIELGASEESRFAHCDGTADIY